MDVARFDHLLRVLMSSRRVYLGGALSLGAGWHGLPAAEAKQRRKKRGPKKAKTCRCFGTTGGSITCARFEPTVSCVACARDADCEAVGLPKGSVCAPFSEGPCAGNCAGGVACLVPCGVDLPQPEI